MARSALNFRLGLSFFAFILIGANDAALGVLLPSLQDYYGIDKSTVGFMFFASVSGYLVSAFSSGLLVERLGRRAYMMLGTLSFALGTLLVALALSFPLTVLGVIFTGFGIAVIDAGLNAYIAGLPNSTGALNYLHAFFGFGALLGPAVALGVLLLGWPWYSLYYLWLVISLILLTGFALTFEKRPPSEEGHHEEGNVLRAMVRVPAVWVAALFLFVYVGLEVSLGVWAYSFLVEERGAPIEFSGIAVSGYWLGLTIGRLVMGKLGAKLGNLQLIRLCLAGTVAGILIVWLVPFAPLEALGLWIIGFSLGPIFPTTISLMSGIVPARILPGTIGFLAGLGAMGAALFPVGVGTLADAFGLWTFMPYEIVLAALMIGLWLRLQAGSKGVLEQPQ